MGLESIILQELEDSGQSQIARHLRTLALGARERLALQLSRFDYQLVRTLSREARERTAPQPPKLNGPAPVVPANRAEEKLTEARRLGAEAIERGDVAVLIVAGGQGTRLRYDGPKGCYPIGPVSRRTLFQIHADKIRAAEQRYMTEIPFYVMTSETNDAEVRRYFQQNSFLGLDPTDVCFCVQRSIPAFDPQGRFLLDAPDHVFVNPDGHGGAFHALDSSGALDDMERRGVQCISCFQVDNPLVPILDPLFIGEHVRARSEMSSKALPKRDPLEKLGIFALVSGRTQVVEYSELTDDLLRAARPDGSLLYRFGSIAVHLIDVEFARRMAAADLPFHPARKTVPSLDEQGRPTRPDQPNAVKFEHFIFDAIPLARNPLVLEVRREDEFAPVKNLSGEDSPETARAAMIAQHRRWLRQAGLDVPEDQPIEISPLFALDPGELQAKAPAIHLAPGPIYLA